MLRWISGVTGLDHIRNEDFRDRYRIAPMAKKLQERLLRWYGYLIPANGNSLIIINVEVDSERPKGWPKERWLHTLDGDLKAS